MWQSPSCPCTRPRGHSAGCDGLLSTALGRPPPPGRSSYFTTPSHSLVITSPIMSTLLLYLFYNSGQKQAWDKTFKLFLISMSMSRLETGELETSIVHGNQTKHTSIRRDKKLKMFTLELKCKPADVVMLKSSSWFNNLHLSNNIVLHHDCTASVRWR